MIVARLFSAAKVSQCSKTQRGADAFAAFTTVIRTIAKRANTSIAQGTSFLAASRRLLPSPELRLNHTAPLQLQHSACTPPRINYFGTDDHDPVAGFIHPYRRDGMVDTRGATSERSSRGIMLPRIWTTE